MAGTVEVVCTISKHAAKMIKAGKAVLSSGGVRELGGEFIELAKPAITSGIKSAASGLNLGNIGTAVNLASSLGSNVQCAFIQKGVNIANLKLDALMVQMASISSAMQGLKTVNVLSWVNSAFGLANCCISVAGFHMTLNRLEGVKGQLHEFFDKYKEDRDHDKIQEYQNILLDLKNDLGFMKQAHETGVFDRQIFIQRESSIEEHLIRARSFLNRILDDFQHRRIDGQIGCQIIFTLTSVFTQTMNEYCCWYYYAHEILHICFQDWFSVLDEIDSPDFKLYLKEYLAFDATYAAISPKVKADARRVTMEGIAQQKNRLLTCIESVKTLPIEDFFRIDEMMNQQLMEQIIPQIAGVKGQSMDDFLEQKINGGDYIETEDEQIMIAIPIRA